MGTGMAAREVPDGAAERLEDCFAEHRDGRLVIGNSRLRRVYCWNGGNLASEALQGDVAWPLAGNEPDTLFPGEDGSAGGGRVTARAAQETVQFPAHLEVNVYHTVGGLQVWRRFRVYPGTPALAIDFFLRGQARGTWSAAAAKAGALAQIEHAAAAAAGRVERIQLDRLALDTHHLALRAVRFFDITDRRNNLLQEQAVVPYRQPLELRGELLLARDLLARRHLFVLREAPCSDVQLADPGCDFLSCLGDLRVYGLGLESSDVGAQEWVRGYGVVIGAAASELELLQALHRYKRQLRRWLPGRDHMILQNTWGDRGQDRRIGEAFALAEIAAGRRLGVTHFQLDDGWQAGRSSNSAFGGTLEGIWNNKGYWEVDPEKFPKGLDPVVKAAKEAGIELCLWFNPSKDNSYANWRNDADCLIGLYRRYGIRTFKIDGVDIPDKQADINLRALLDAVMAATGGEAVFNFDVTAGHRVGYHYFTEYGNKFLENRYTDWTNYYPHWTLRNLWQLSRYVPAQTLQIEFLNRWRNGDKYPARDPLAPRHVPFAYCFGVTMMAQPLAWFEGGNLPEEAFAIAPLVRKYRQVQRDLHNGVILPIGDEPNGTAWCGLQSLNGNSGFIAVYRELNDKPQAGLKVLGLAGRTLSVRRILGEGRCLGRRVAADGTLRFAMPAPFSFGLFRYERAAE